MLRAGLTCWAFAHVNAWLVVSVDDYGARGDNLTDNTAAFRSALAAVTAAGGGEVIVPAPGLYKTLPVNLSSNVRLTVDGEMWALENITAWPIVPPVFTYTTLMPTPRHQPFIFFADGHATNISIAGSGVIDGAGPYWWCKPGGQGACPNYEEWRPHLVSLQNVTGVEITGVTLRNSAFWTLRPVFCTDVHIHDMEV